MVIVLSLSHTHVHSHSFYRLSLSFSICFYVYTQPYPHTFRYTTPLFLSLSLTLSYPLPTQEFTLRSQWQPKVWWRQSRALIRLDWKVRNSFFFSFSLKKLFFQLLSKRIFCLFSENLDILCTLAFEEIEFFFVFGFEIFNYYSELIFCLSSMLSFFDNNFFSFHFLGKQSKNKRITI